MTGQFEAVVADHDARHSAKQRAAGQALSLIRTYA